MSVRRPVSKITRRMDLDSPSASPGWHDHAELGRHQLGGGAAGCHRDGQAAAQRLGDRRAVALPLCRQGEHIGGRHACSSAASSSAPANSTRAAMPAWSACARRAAAWAGSRVASPVITSCQGRSKSRASARSSTAWPLRGTSAPTESTTQSRPRRAQRCAARPARRAGAPSQGRGRPRTRPPTGCARPRSSRPRAAASGRRSRSAARTATCSPASARGVV